MSIKAKDRLKHILIETEYLADVAKRISSIEELAANEDLKRSVRASIEVIGEAVKTLPAEIKQLSPQLEWNKIARMRDNLVHRYHDVNYEIVWLVIQKKAPILGQEVTKILNQLNWSEYYEYRAKIADVTVDSESYFHRIGQQTKIDLAIAKTILKEYPAKFRNVAISQIKDIIGAGERARELKDISGSITPSDYVNQIIAALPQNIVQEIDEQSR